MLLNRGGKGLELIKLTDIEKRYGTNQQFLALRKLSLSIEEGELVAVMGKSGSGKSTMLNILSGIDCYDNGSYFFVGKDIVMHLQPLEEKI
jgi:putative ABC transport system ATP-binding protein